MGTFGRMNVKEQALTQYGSIEGYFEEGLGIDKAGRQQLRDRFLIVA